jgi:hypothetical protein
MLIASAVEAHAADTPYNRFITLAWEHCGLSPRENVKATGHFIKQARDWAWPYRLPWCWVQETGDRYGAHVHMLIHVPPELIPLFRGKPRRWMKTCLGGRYVIGGIDTKVVAYSGAVNAMPEAYQANVMAELHYMCKSAPAGSEHTLDMVQWRSVKSMAWGRTYTVFGKRAARWQRRKQ